MGKKLLDLEWLQNLMYSRSSAILMSSILLLEKSLWLMSDSVKQQQNKHLPDLDHCYQFPATPVL